MSCVVAMTRITKANLYILCRASSSLVSCQRYANVPIMYTFRTLSAHGRPWAVWSWTSRTSYAYRDLLLPSKGTNWWNSFQTIH